MSFLNIGDDGKPEEDDKIGKGLKRRPREPRPPTDKKAVARASEAEGFTRRTASQEAITMRRGRPPLNDDMVYWRIYIEQGLREEIAALRDREGRRLNDLLADMLGAYKAATKATGNE